MNNDFNGQNQPGSSPSPDPWTPNPGEQHGSDSQYPNQDYITGQQYNNSPLQGQPQQPYGYAPNMAAAPFPPKRSHKWLLGLSIIPILALVAVLCFFFVPSVKTFVFRNVLGTTKYYEYVEASCDEKMGQLFTNTVLEKSAAMTKNGVTANSTISLALASELSNQNGFDLNKLSCDIASTSKDKRATASYAFKYDGKQIVTLDMYADSENGKVYFKFPELNDKYLDCTELLTAYSSFQTSSNLSSSGLFNMSTARQQGGITNCTSTEQEMASEIAKKLQKSLTPELIKELGFDYVTFLMDDLGDKGAIKLSKKENYTLGSATKSCDKFTIALTESQVKDVMVDVLKKAKDDERIQKIASDMLGTSALYSTALDSIIQKCNDLPASDSKDSVLTMDVYTDGKTILGRNFSLSHDSESSGFGYGVVENNNQLVMNMFLKGDNGETLDATLDSKKDGDAYDGSLTFSASGQSFSIDFKGYKVNKDLTIDGVFSLTAGTAKFTATLASSNGAQSMTLGGTVGGNDLGNCIITSTSKEDSSVSISEVASSDLITLASKEDFAQYLENSNLESFLQNLMTSFNLPAQISAKQMADSIISSIRNSSTPDSGLGSNSDTPSITEPSDSDTPSSSASPAPDTNSSSIKPEDYNLPSNATINEDGSYIYSLSDQELDDLKKKGTDYKSFGKNKDEIYPSVEALAKQICGANTSPTTDITNKAMGSIKDDHKTISHYTEINWFSEDSFGDYVVLRYDSLTDEVLSITVNTTKSDKVYPALTDCYNVLGLSSLSSDLSASIQDKLTKGEDLDISEDLADNSLYLRSSEYDSEKEYYLSINSGYNY